MQSCKIVFLIMEEGSNRLGICTGKSGILNLFSGVSLWSYHWFLLGWSRCDGYLIMSICGPCLHMRGYLLCCRGHKNVAPSKSTELRWLTRRTFDVRSRHFCAGQRTRIHHGCSQFLFLSELGFLS